MIKEFIDAWNENKNKLEEYFKNTEQREYGTYEEIVKKLFEIIINPYLIINANYPMSQGFNTNNMTVIDDGDYQGTQLFIIPLDTYQPNGEDYVCTNTYYGSCSGCDTLQAIQDWDLEKKPNASQVEDYMQLSLHLLQKCKMLYSEEEN